MPLESATYVDDLVSTNPLGTDDASLGDDHIRLIKSVLKNTFPNLDGALTTKLAALNGVSQLITVGSDGKTLTFNFPSGGTVAAVSDWTSASPVPANQADARYVLRGQNLQATDSAVASLWMDLTTDGSTLPRMGILAANGTTYGIYCIAKVNALIAAALAQAIQNTNPGISGAYPSTSICVKPSADADGRDLPYLAYDGNTKIVTLARDDAKLDISGGTLSGLLKILVGTGYWQFGSEGYATAFRNSNVATDGIIDFISMCGSPNNNVARITADGGYAVLGGGDITVRGEPVALKSDLPSLPFQTLKSWTLTHVNSMTTFQLPQTYKTPPLMWCQDVSSVDVHYACIRNVTTTDYFIQTSSNDWIPELQVFCLGDPA